MLVPESFRIAGVEIVGMANLQKVKALNEQGQRVLFAPNHVRPNSKVKQQIAMAEDYPKFKKVLKELGMNSAVVFRGDGDMEVGKSKVMRFIYDIHRKIFSALGRVVSGGGVPLSINAKEPKLAMGRNVTSIKEMFSTLKEKNLTIFPYGNWFPAREQKFEDLQTDDFVPMGDYEKWRQSLKSGFIRIAKRTKSPIVPVYFDNTDGHWKMEFGEPMEVDEKDDNLEVGREYLQTMQAMRNRNLLQP